MKDYVKETLPWLSNEEVETLIEFSKVGFKDTKKQKKGG